MHQSLSIESACPPISGTKLSEVAPSDLHPVLASHSRFIQRALIPYVCRLTMYAVASSSDKLPMRLCGESPNHEERCAISVDQIAIVALILSGKAGLVAREPAASPHHVSVKGQVRRRRRRTPAAQKPREWP